MRNRGLWVNLALLGAVALILIGSFLLAPRPGGDEEAFAGTDSVVTETLESDGVEPWFSPVFELGSGELESGLFALQAGIGAGVLGYVLGNLRGRAKARKEFVGQQQPPAGDDSASRTPSAETTTGSV